MKGLTIVEENALGFCQIALHYTADPERDIESPDPLQRERAQAWLQAQRRSYPDPNDWAREYELNFFVGKGTRVFPQFTEARHSLSRIEYTFRKRIIRAWDFGWHCPICLVFQTDGRDRLLVLREIVGFRQTTREFAQTVIDHCARHYPNHSAGYEDICDPAGQQVKSIESELNERRDIEVLNGLGIYPSYEYGWSRKDGRALVHQLLALRADGTPGMYVDRSTCPQLIQAFLGQYIYPERKLDGKIAEDPNDEEHPWGDLMAALRYGVTGLHTRLGLRRLMPQVPDPDPHAPADWTGYGTPKRR